VDSYLAENPLGQDAHATFAIYGDELDPEDVTARLSAAPDLTRTKGQSVASRSRTISQRTGVWLLESTSRVRSTSLEKHIEFLLERVEPHRDEVRVICSKYQAQAVFICYWVPAGFHGGPMLSPSILKRVAGLEAALWFEIYADLRDSEEKPSGG
jgi:hypothetical protein